MKNILLILVGGTICTARNEEGTLSVSGRAGIHLRENFYNSDSLYKEKVNIHLSENLYILSENMTVDKWNLMIATYRNKIREREYDGVIFAHGTDTLAYSAALFSLILSGTEVPVFFVSANEPLTSEHSNGNINFKTAVECICRGISPNVYVVYKNISDRQIYLHLASRLEQCRNYSEDFYSVGAVNITDISEENYKSYFDKIEEMYPKNRILTPVNALGKWQLKPCILMLQPYVGINYAVFDYSRYKAVLHGTYHSGTACSEKSRYWDKYGESSVLYMIDKCASLEPRVDTYFAPSTLCGEIYETVGIIGNHTSNNQKISFLYGYTNEMAYAKLLLGYSVFDDGEERNRFIHTECNFEIINKKSY